jgi:anti-sigma-K factor RskA
MTATLDDDELRALAAEYALGLLEPAEARAFERALEVDPDLRAEYAFWAGELADLAAAIPAVPPPPGLRAKLEARLFPEERQSFWRRLGLVPALAGALGAALIALAVTNLGLLAPQPGLAPAFVAEIAGEGRALVVRATFDPARGTLRVAPQVGGAPEGSVLELWLIAQDGVPVSLGLLAAGGETVLVPPADLAAQLPGATLAVSAEPPGGSPTGAPTRVLGAGPVTPA